MEGLGENAAAKPDRWLSLFLSFPFITPLTLGFSCNAGLVTSLLTNPIWVIKTRMCLQRPGQPGSYRGLVDAVVQIYRTEGVASFYKGLVPSLFGVAHGAVQFMAYEELKKLFRSSERTELVNSTFFLFFSLRCFDFLFAWVPRRCPSTCAWQPCQRWWHLSAPTRTRLCGPDCR